MPGSSNSRTAKESPFATARPAAAAPHALIVDDDPNGREGLAALVVAEGFTVSQAGSLRDARVQLTRRLPDLVLIDLYLPDGTGLELVGDFGEGPRPSLLLITGRACVDTAVEALRHGLSDYLTKPVDLDRLRGLLARAREAKAPDFGPAAAEALRQAAERGRFGPLAADARSLPPHRPRRALGGDGADRR